MEYMNSLHGNLLCNSSCPVAAAGHLAILQHTITLLSCHQIKDHDELANGPEIDIGSKHHQT